jgi:hypothetical protein
VMASRPSVPRGQLEFGLHLDSNQYGLGSHDDRKSMKRFGGPEGIRTLDLFHAMEARSQLRHRPSESTI